jgi:hypothetical protein
MSKGYGSEDADERNRRARLAPKPEDEEALAERVLERAKRAAEREKQGQGKGG